MDPDSLSGPVIKSTIEELNVFFNYENHIPDNLDIYQNILIVLGRKFGQYILTEYEGEKLVDFLNAGGNIYMEGGMTWFDDPQTAVHPMFNINTESLASWDYIDTIAGITGTLTEGLTYIYSGNFAYYNYYLVPIEPAYTILERLNEQHGFAVAYDNGSYKTIGSSIDFSGLNDGVPPSTKNYLMAKMLEFFGLDSISTFNKEYYNDLATPVIYCYPNPFSGQTTISFYLSEKNQVDITIYDIYGNKITTIITGKRFSAGLHSVIWEENYISNGIYICQLKTKENISSIKIVNTN